jgi:hypothetical protein
MKNKNVNPPSNLSEQFSKVVLDNYQYVKDLNQEMILFLNSKKNGKQSTSSRTI